MGLCEIAEIEKLMLRFGNLGKKRIDARFLAHGVFARAAELSVEPEVFALKAFLRVYLPVIIEKKD